MCEAEGRFPRTIVVMMEAATDNPSGPPEARGLVREWLSGMAGYSPHTRANYGFDLADYLAWTDAAGVDPLTARRADVERYVRGLEALGRSPATRQRRLSALSTWYGWLTDQDLCAVVPTARIRRPQRTGESTTLGLARDELARLLATAEAEGPAAHALVCLLALNGLRISEVTGARSVDLDSDRGHRILRVTRKGGKRQAIPLAPRTAAALDEAAVRSGASLLPFDRFSATRLIRRLARRVGIAKRISPHSLRHTFVTLSLDAGVALRDVQSAAGHADPKTTMGYDRARDVLDRAATYRLAAYLAEVV